VRMSIKSMSVGGHVCHFSFQNGACGVSPLLRLICTLLLGD